MSLLRKSAILLFFLFTPFSPFAQNVEHTNNAVEPEMITVGGGTFEMGSNDGNENEKPVHKVTVKNFHIARYEVTQAQWRAIIGTAPTDFARCDNAPEQNVSWDDVQDFIKKLNAKTGKQYRLPTEAEWEYAARGGDKSRHYKYSGSDNILSVAWCRDNSRSVTHPVGLKQANELGIYDMTGNVWEWCDDWYEDRYYTKDPNTTDVSVVKVVRGGSWYSNPYCSRITYRDSFAPDGRSINIGFRLASD